MSIGAVLNNAFSALQLNQEALRVTSNNVANVNTPGYARRVVEQEASTIQGISNGVAISQIKRIVDQFFVREALTARSTGAQYAAQLSIHDRLQSIFGTPDQNSSLPGQIDRAMASLADLSFDVTSAVQRTNAISDLNLMAGSFASLADQVQDIRTDIDREISFNITTLNSLFEEVHSLNSSIERQLVMGGSASALQDQRDIVVEKIASIMDVKTLLQPNGSLHLSTQDGFSLVGALRVELNYTAQNAMSTSSVPQPIVATTVNPSTGAALPQILSLDSHITGGALRGLLNMRDGTLPELASEIGQLAGAVADRLNAVHNNNSAVPAPSVLVGRNTGLVAADSHNFTGQMTLAVSAADGTLASQIAFDFTAGTYAVDGGPSIAIGGGTIGDVVAAMNAGLGANGSASLTGGVLTVQAAAGGDGISFLQDSANPSARAGRGFSHYFGLNDLIEAQRPSTFETGVSGTDAHGFTPGQTIDFVVRHPDGREAIQYSYTVAGASFDDIITGLNNPVTGLGSFMSFSLGANGEISATPQSGYSGFQLHTVLDSTARSGSGVAFTEMFGLGTRYQMEQAQGMAVASRISANPDQLALAKLDLSVGTPGSLVLTVGDNRGALDLDLVRSTAMNFAPSGHLGAASASVEEYAALILADMGTQAAQIDALNIDSRALSDEVELRKQEVQGVSMDEELANMMVFQQSYNAAARMITAARELYDTLLSMA